MAQTTRIVQLLQLAVYDAHKCIPPLHPTPRSIPQLIQIEVSYTLFNIFCVYYSLGIILQLPDQQHIYGSFEKDVCWNSIIDGENDQLALIWTGKSQNKMIIFQGKYN